MAAPRLLPHLETMMTLKPWALRSRAVSTMDAREDRFRLPCSARMRLEVPTLITCEQWEGA